MQDVEDFDQTNEGNDEERRKKKHLHGRTQHSNKIVHLATLERD